MTKKQFETTADTLCVIVVLDLVNNRFFVNFYEWRTEDIWLRAHKRDFPGAILYSCLNPAARRQRDELFGLV